MADERPRSVNLAFTTGLYQTRVGVVIPSGSGVDLVVRADPQRWMLRVYSFTGGATVGLVLPADGSALAGLNLLVPAPIESKFRDAPDWTQGPWYGSGVAAAGWIVVESLYVKG